MNHEEGTLATGDGLELYWQSWQPPGEPEGTLLFVHGLAEHSGRYLNPVHYFVARGWACYGIDYRGHGKSPGPRVHVDSFDEFVDDLIEAFIRLMGTPDDFTGPVNLGNPGEFSIKELAEKVLALVDNGSKLVYKPLPEDDPTQRQPARSLIRSGSRARSGLLWLDLER